MMKKFIRFGKPNILACEMKQVVKVIKSGWIGTGPSVFNFEKKFSKFKKAKNAIAVNSCTAGLHLSLKSLNFKKNSEIITTAMTFCSTINSIIMSGYKPVIVDIRMDTFNIDEKAIEKKITPKTKAILVVHFNGLPCEMTYIQKIAKKYNLHVIEDCAHSIEAKYKKEHLGNFGTTGNFSFYANKNITTGEGGMILTKNKALAEKIRVLRLHGMSKDAWKRFTPDMVKLSNDSYQHYDVTETGYKYNMIDMQAVLGIAQLKRINQMRKKRKIIYNNYEKKFKTLPVFFQKTNDYDYSPAYHLFFMVIDKKKTNKNRDDLLKFLLSKKIGVAVHYRSVTELTNYQKIFKWNKNTCPNSHYVGQNTFSLPLYPDLKKSEQNYIIDKVLDFFNA